MANEVYNFAFKVTDDLPFGFRVQELYHVPTGKVPAFGFQLPTADAKEKFYLNHDDPDDFVVLGGPFFDYAQEDFETAAVAGLPDGFEVQA